MQRGVVASDVLGPWMRAETLDLMSRAVNTSANLRFSPASVVAATIADIIVAKEEPLGVRGEGSSAVTRVELATMPARRFVDLLTQVSVIQP